MNYARITGTGSYLPEKILTNQELETMVDTTNEWIVERVGIHSRHIVKEGETVVTMAEQAARQALSMANLKPTDIELLIVATCTPEMFLPSTACLVQQRLGINRGPAFDVSAACSGFIYALNVAQRYIQSGEMENVLVIGSEVMSRLVDWTDRSTCVLFGDGAGAVVLRRSDEPGIVSCSIDADSDYAYILYAPNCLKGQENNHANAFLSMQGKEIFKLAVKTLGKSVAKTLADNNIAQSEIDWLIPHQANLRIISAAAKSIHLPIDNVIITVDTQGNTSAASIPLALDQGVRDGRVQANDLLLLESFGAGFSWGSALVYF